MNGVMALDIDLYYISAQAVGFIAMALGIISYQSKRRVKIIFLQTVANACWCIQYFMLGAMTAVVANVIGIARNIVYLFKGKYKFADSVFVPIICIIAFVVTGIFTYESLFDILPIFAMVLSSIAFFISSEKIIRYVCIFVCTSWIIYSIYAGSIAGAMSDSFTLISLFIAIARYDIIDKYNKNSEEL